MRLTALWPVLLSGAAFALVAYRKQKHTWVVAPARIRVVPQAESWLIPVTVLARKSLPGPLVLEGVYSQGRDLSGALDTPLPVERAGLLGRGMKVLWEVRISAARLPFAVEDRQDYPVEVRLHRRHQRTRLDPLPGSSHHGLHRRSDLALSGSGDNRRRAGSAGRPAGLRHRQPDGTGKQDLPAPGRHRPGPGELSPWSLLPGPGSPLR